MIFLNINKLSATKIKLYSVLTIILLVSADQIIKLMVDDYLKPIGSVPVINKVLQLSYYENDGAMMGMLSGKTTVMTVFASVCLLLVLYILYFHFLAQNNILWKCS